LLQVRKDHLLLTVDKSDSDLMQRTTDCILLLLLLHCSGAQGPPAADGGHVRQ
jgi:hypothetical protein